MPRRHSIKGWSPGRCFRPFLSSYHSILTSKIEASLLSSIPAPSLPLIYRHSTQDISDNVRLVSRTRCGLPPSSGGVCGCSERAVRGSHPCAYRQLPCALCMRLGVTWAGGGLAAGCCRAVAACGLRPASLAFAAVATVACAGPSRARDETLDLL